MELHAGQRLIIRVSFPVPAESEMVHASRIGERVKSSVLYVHVSMLAYTGAQCGEPKKR
jgi:hypothetical protein